MRGLPKLIDTEGKMQECNDPFHAETPAENVVPFPSGAVVTTPDDEVIPHSQNPKPQPKARCPHQDCSADPVDVFFEEIKFPDGRTAFAFFCTECRRLVPVALSPMVIRNTMPPGFDPRKKN